MVTRTREKQEKRARRRARVRAKIRGTAQKPRLSVFRSNRGVFLQLVDDAAGRTIVSARDAAGGKTGRPADRAFAAGKRLAELATKRGIERAVFDRGGYRYHGIVKRVAEGAREGGLRM